MDRLLKWSLLAGVCAAWTLALAWVDISTGAVSSMFFALKVDTWPVWLETIFALSLPFVPLLLVKVPAAVRRMPRPRRLHLPYRVAWPTRRYKRAARARVKVRTYTTRP